MVKDGAKVAEVGGRGDYVTISAEGEVVAWFGESVWTSEDYFSFVAVKLEKTELEPRLFFRDAGGQGGVSGRSYGFGGEVQLDVGKAVKLETMAVDYVTKGGM